MQSQHHFYEDIQILPVLGTDSIHQERKPFGLLFTQEIVHGKQKRYNTSWRVSSALEHNKWISDANASDLIQY